MAFTVRDRLVLDAPGHDDHLSRRERREAIAELDREVAGQDQEQFVAVGMAVPGELPLRLGDADLVAVVAGDDARVPMVREAGELLGKVDRLRRAHRSISPNTMSS